MPILPIVSDCSAYHTERCITCYTEFQKLIASASDLAQCSNFTPFHYAQQKAEITAPRWASGWTLLDRFSTILNNSKIFKYFSRCAAARSRFNFAHTFSASPARLEHECIRQINCRLGPFMPESAVK